MRKFCVIIYDINNEEVITAWKTEACCIEAVEYEIASEVSDILGCKGGWIHDMGDDLYRFGYGDTTEGTVLITEIKVGADTT